MLVQVNYYFACITHPECGKNCGESKKQNHEWRLCAWRAAGENMRALYACSHNGGPWMEKSGLEG